VPFAALYRAAVCLTALAGIASLMIDSHGSLHSFVYFTVQSNALLALIFGLAAFGRATTRLRGAATLYIAITGSVYHLVLANPASPFHVVDSGAHTLHNFLLHTATPLLAVLDWILLTREPVRWWNAALWLAYPLAYLAFALIRGAIVHKYPYPFVDAGTLGYSGVTVSGLVFAVLFFLLGLVLIGTGTLARLGLERTGVRRSPHTVPVHETAKEGGIDPA